MSLNNGRDYLYVIWKNSETGSRVQIGELSKNGKYEFRYLKPGIEEASQQGFSLLVAFPEVDKVYLNEEVFAAFSSRLPDKRRKDIKVILEKYGLSSYEVFELLRKSGGKLPTDSIEFIDPIFENHTEDIERSFYIAGTRYRDLCEGESHPNCKLNFEVDLEEELDMYREVDNEYDSNAVLLKKKTGMGQKIGYIPAYYSRVVSNALLEGRKVRCIVKDFDRNSCQECIRVTLFIKYEVE